MAKALLPSSCAAAADGPKQAIPCARTASATPRTRGASGPTTTRSTPEPPGERGDRGPVERVDGVVGRDLGGAGVARRDVHLDDLRVAGEREGQRVLTTPGAEDEDAERCGHVGEAYSVGPAHG